MGPRGAAGCPGTGVHPLRRTWGSMWGSAGWRVGGSALGKDRSSAGARERGEEDPREREDKEGPSVGMTANGAPGNKTPGVARGGAGRWRWRWRPGDVDGSGGERRTGMEREDARTTGDEDGLDAGALGPKEERLKIVPVGLGGSMATARVPSFALLFSFSKRSRSALAYGPRDPKGPQGTQGPKGPGQGPDRTKHVPISPTSPTSFLIKPSTLFHFVLLCFTLLYLPAPRAASRSFAIDSSRLCACSMQLSPTPNARMHARTHARTRVVGK